MKNNEVILSQIPLRELVAAIREAVKQELELQQKSPANSSNKGYRPISEKELCNYLRISLPTAIRWRQKGKIPFLRIGSVIRYDLSEVIEAIEKNKK